MIIENWIFDIGYCINEKPSVLPEGLLVAIILLLR